MPKKSSTKREVGFVCENCGNKVDDVIKLGYADGQPFCEICIDDFIIDSHIDFGTMLIKKSSLA